MIHSIAVMTAATATGVVLCAASGWAASYDCQPYKVQKRCPEAIICSDATLSTLDEKVNALYLNVNNRTSSALAALLTRRHNAWIRERNNCGCEVDCLASQYELRLKELGTIPK